MQDITIGNVRSKKGEVVKGAVQLGEYPDGPVLAPLMIATGMHDGPTIWLQGAIHGPEFAGPMAIASLLNELDLASFSGRIVGLLVANPLGFRALSRLTPQDGMNANREFPGSARGTVTEQLTHKLFSLAFEFGDIFVDLHAGLDAVLSPLYSIYHRDDSEASRKSAELSACVGSDIQWANREAYLQGAAFTQFTKAGKPALIIECSVGNRRDDHEQLLMALRNILKHLEMLPGKPVMVGKARGSGKCYHPVTTRGGFWRPSVGLGEQVRKNQKLGEIVDIYGAVVEEFTSPFESGWIGYVFAYHLPVYAGEALIELVSSEGD
jgi:predicted deacylase